MVLPVPVNEAARLSETPVAFARVCLCGVETAIAFAGENWVFLVHFPGAEVMPVSPVLCWGRAVVLLVSTSPRCRASVKSWVCAQVVDGLFVRLLSRPLGVVRIRWGFAAEAGVAVASVVWLRRRWVAAGPGRASRSSTPSEARVWRSHGRAAAHRRTEQPHPGTAGLAPHGGLAAGRRTEVWWREDAGS